MTHSVKTIGINRGNEEVLEDGGLTTDVMEDNNKIAGSAIGGVFLCKGLDRGTDLSEEMKDTYL